MARLLLRSRSEGFVLYADHDEYTTLFAARTGMLSKIARSLVEAGFQEVPDYLREL